MATTIASPRHLVASLISSISDDEHSAITANPLKDTTPEIQKALLTLHVLFPNELLPALDLLDRSLLTRFVLALPCSGRQDAAPSERSEESARRQTAIYYVRSAQPQTRHRSLAMHNTTSYEVRLQSWSCSCPAFAFAAFPAEAPAPSLSHSRPSDGSHLSDANEQGSSGWTFGGLTRGEDMPVCKHLLACVLVERSPMFQSFAEEREVSVEELAGWAAGWGD